MYMDSDLLSPKNLCEVPWTLWELHIYHPRVQIVSVIRLKRGLPVQPAADLRTDSQESLASPWATTALTFKVRRHLSPCWLLLFFFLQELLLGWGLTPQ